MIMASQIPATAAAFVSRCQAHLQQGLYPSRADGYRAFLIEQTRQRDPQLLFYIERNDRAEGTQGTFTDADHIVPRSVWHLLMPIQFHTAPEYDSLLGNLAWRSIVFNRRHVAGKKDGLIMESYDHHLIEQIRLEATRPANGPQNRIWADSRIEWFLQTKQIESNPLSGYYVETARLDGRDPTLDVHGYQVPNGWLRT
ncbi:hypothetical protein [Pelagibius sp. Alg239-R121]|uniref:hypothetical protein n=1 Tax=Pelagibius sp. Alg239-R121 TaxID=2993448 RepID=UPI0024A62B0D|nr:hypothetical protein [Pelagibius sp. Alg239-R121]